MRSAERRSAACGTAVPLGTTPHRAGAALPAEAARLETVFPGLRRKGRSRSELFLAGCEPGPAERRSCLSLQGRAVSVHPVLELFKAGASHDLAPALAHGLALALCVAVLGGISGGHFNPAVSLGAWLVGGLSLPMLLPYCVSQLCGGVIGAALAKVGAAARRGCAGRGAAGGAVSGACMNPARAFGPALVANHWDYHWVYWVGPVLGSLLRHALSFSGAVSGACMNPARAFGPALVANHWDYHWVYWVGPVLGSLLVSALVRLLLGDQKTRLLLR
ncbi:PREDICTED: aquaporin-8 [Tinamus guttatus]|uniref:aquaporin-8 n=1 Tax=Tinamus guttatus TaxID=94827 RepID=UPI00052F2716|nr:PREDICTED: aquaporin-8 [Tinamus guttatus]